MDKQRNHVRLHRIPEVRSPSLIAAWSGMGGVALLAANYVRQALHAVEFGEIDPGDYYAPPGEVIVQDGLVQPVTLPETQFYAWQSGQGSDLVFVIGTEQPPDAYQMAVEVIDAARRLGVTRVYTAAAYPTFIHHTSEPNVWGTATHPELLDELREYGVSVMSHGTIGGLNGLLLGVAKEQDLHGVCLLGEIPIYATQMINPKASRAVLEVMMQMLDIEISLEKLTIWAQDIEPQIEKLYRVLPEDIKEAFERGEGTIRQFMADAPPGEKPLVADEAFFSGIERFLRQHRRPDRDREGPDEEQDGPRA